VKVAADYLGAANQVAYGRIRVTNVSGAACSLSGFPGVSLLLNGAKIGSPATHSGQNPSVIALQPSAVAQAKFTASSSCNAPLSDTMRVAVPGTNSYQDVPFELRACSITVEPLSL